MIEAVFLATAIPLFFLIIFLEEKEKVFVYFLLWGLSAALVANYTYRFFGVLGLELVNLNVTIAPLIEEFFKALPLFLLFIFAKRDYSKTLLPLAMASGIGFSILENYLYVYSSGLTGFGVVIYAVTRAISTSIMHGVNTALIGYGIFIIKGFNKRVLPALLFGLYTIAITIHATFNLYVEHSEHGKIVAVILPLVLFCILLLLYTQEES